MKILIKTEKQKKQYRVPIGTIVDDKKDRCVYKYPSGKVYIEHKSMSKTYGNAYDWRSDG